MTRKAFLIQGYNSDIGSPNYSAQFDSSVGKNIGKMKLFLESGLGGFWTKGYDLEVLDNKTLNEVINCLQNESFDFTFIYFSGHGERSNGRDFIYLNNRKEKLEISKLRTKSAKQLIISDACRYSHGSEVLESIPFEFKFSELEKRETIDIFYDYIKNCGDSITTIFSTQKDCPAGFGPEGGCFTQALLCGCVDWNRIQNSDSMLSINEAVKMANEILLSQNQQAEIFTNPNTYSEFPFAIYTVDK